MKPNHPWSVGLLLVPWLIVSRIIHLAIILPHYRTQLCWQECWSFYCLIFLAWWWVVYFSGGWLRIWTLRLFLKKKSALRKECEEGGAQATGETSKHHDPEKTMLNKASLTVSSHGIFIAVIALFLSVVVAQKPERPYMELLRCVIFVIAAVTILLMVLAIDLMHTVADAFIHGDKTPFGYRRHFYRKVGALGPHGGIRYAFCAYASFTFFLIGSLAYLHTSLAGIGVAVFAYLAYPIYFGYQGKRKGRRIEKVEVHNTRWPAVILCLIFLAVTIIAEFVLRDLPMLGV